MKKCTTGFLKGLATGAVMGGAMCLMMDPPDTTKIKKAYKKTNRALKTVGYAIEELVAKN